MKKNPEKSSGKTDVISKWDKMTPFARLEMIRNNVELFWALELVTRSEVEMLMAMSEGAREYIVSREEHPIFTSLEIKEMLEAQAHRERLQAALKLAVF